MTKNREELIRTLDSMIRHALVDLIEDIEENITEDVSVFSKKDPNLRIHSLEVVDHDSGEIVMIDIKVGTRSSVEGAEEEEAVADCPECDDAWYEGHDEDY